MLLKCVPEKPWWFQGHILWVALYVENTWMWESNFFLIKIFFKLSWQKRKWEERIMSPKKSELLFSSLPLDESYRNCLWKGNTYIVSPHRHKYSLSNYLSKNLSHHFIILEQSRYFLTAWWHSFAVLLLPVIRSSTTLSPPPPRSPHCLSSIFLHIFTFLHKCLLEYNFQKLKTWLFFKYTKKIFQKFFI